MRLRQSFGLITGCTTPSDSVSSNQRSADPHPGTRLAAGVIHRPGDDLVIYQLVYPVDYPQLHNITVDCDSASGYIDRAGFN